MPSLRVLLIAGVVIGVHAIVLPRRMSESQATAKVFAFCLSMVKSLG